MDRIVPLYAEVVRRQREDQRALAMQAFACVLQNVHGAEFALEPAEALWTVLDALRGIRRQRTRLQTSAAWRVPLTVCR